MRRMRRPNWLKPNWLKRFFVAGVLRVFAVRCLGVASLLALEVTLGRRLGVAGFGLFAFLLAVATVTSHLAPLGWLNAITRLVRTYSDGKNASLLKGSLVTAHGAAIAGLVLAGLILIALVALAGHPDRVLLLKLGLPLGIGLTMIELHRYVLRGQHASVLGEALPMLLLPVGVLCAIWSLALDSVAAVVHAYIAVCGFILVLSAVRIAGRLPPDTSRVRADYRLRSWAGMAGAMLVGTASDEVTARAAVLVLGAISTPEATGLYQAATRLALMTVFVLRAVTAVSAPRMAELYHAGKMTELRSVYGRSCLVSASCAAPFLLVFGLLPELALGLFGKDFREAAPLLQVLAIGYFGSALTGPCATGLMMIGREKAYGAIATLGAGTILAGLLVSVSQFGALGAAVTTATVIATVNLCYAAVMLHAIRMGRGGPQAIPHSAGTVPSAGRSA